MKLPPEHLPSVSGVGVRVRERVRVGITVRVGVGVPGGYMTECIYPEVSAQGVSVLESILVYLYFILYNGGNSPRRYAA